MCDTCDDSCFELIKKYKQRLLDATNISDSPEEMAVIDNILFRFWQMGWLKPSAQVEPLKDKEQRIFLAAMGREEKVCKQVDEEWRDRREPYEDSLVHVCREIERKVKKALFLSYEKEKG